MNVRLVVRTWRRTPALAAVVVVTLALGVAGTTTAFTLAYSVLVRPLPFPDAERLVWITTFDSRVAGGDREPVIDSGRYPLFADWREHATSFEQLGAWAGAAPDVFTITGIGSPERVPGLRVTQQLLPMLGAGATLGTLFQPGDDVPDAEPKVVLSHGYWQRRFGAHPDVVGQSMTIENEPHTIAGVLPADFPLSASVFAGAPIDVYLPLEIDRAEDIGGFMAVVGRLRPGVAVEQARAELATRREAMAQSAFPWMTVLAQEVTPMPALVTRNARSPLLLLFGAIGCVLMLACANVANLLLMRSSARQHEMQVRAALGATRGRVFRQTVAESAVLAAAGVAVGATLAAAMIETIRTAPWLAFARIGEVRLDWTGIACAAAVGGVTTLVFGSLPLLHLRRDAADALRPHGGVSAARGAAYAQRMALAVQVALTLVLAVAGGQLFRSFAALLQVHPGFEPRDAIAIRVDPANRLPGADRLPFFTQVIERVAALPGVEAAGMTIHVPMGDRPSMGWDAIPEGQKDDPSKDIVAGRIISPGYLAAAGIQILSGRDFDSRDVRPNPMVMAVNDTFARRLRAEGREPLGSRFLVLGNIREVVAVVADVRHRTLDAEVGHEAYIPMGQAPTFFESYDLVVRAADPMPLVPAIREAIWSIDANQALGLPVALEDYIDRTLRPRRLLTGLVGGFAAAALLIAALGVYGVVGYRVAQRAKELAIRVALGSPRWRVTTTVLRDTLTFVGLGLAAGVPLALAAGTAVRSYLFGVGAHDTVTIATATGIVLTTALVAAYVPARRAPRVDPLAALRME